MSTPQSTPIRHAKLGIASTKSLPLANEYKRLLNDQHQRLSLKHQQDLDLIDDIRSYIKARLSIEKDYTGALSKLAKQNSSHIAKKFALFHQLEDSSQIDEDDDQQQSRPKRRGLLGGGNKNLEHSSSSNQNNPQQPNSISNNSSNSNNPNNSNNSNSNNNNFDVPDRACSLYKVWSEHINRLQITSKSRSDQFEQLTLLVYKLKDIRSHKAHIGKKCLDTHLKRIQEDLIVSMVELERARKLYYEDESQAKKARENEEKIKKKRSGLLTKFTDLQAKKEKSSAQREATDIQSTQARNDYIMALAAANAHLDYYYQRDLNDFINLIDDGVLDHCKIFMATLSECDINSLKDSLAHAQFCSKLIAMTGSQQTNSIFLECDQSQCLKGKTRPLEFEPCNNDPINKISLEHNADYALQHEIDKWFTWFKKECRNLSHLMHQLETCQNALADGKKSIELNGQTIEDLEPKVIDLKQQIRKCEAAKLKAQARLKVIKEGGMPIEEWSAVESEIAADMARAQEEQERARRLRELKQAVSNASAGDQSNVDVLDQTSSETDTKSPKDTRNLPIQLQISRDDPESDSARLDPMTPVAGTDGSMHNLASVSRSTTGYLIQKQQNAISGYSALTDPSLVWQDDYSNTGVWGGSNTTTIQAPARPAPETVVVTRADDTSQITDQNNNKLLANNNAQQQQISANNMSIQSSSPLSAIVANSNGQQLGSSTYQMGMMSETYKSDYECDYTLTSSQQPQNQLMRSSASSVEPHNAVMHPMAEAEVDIAKVEPDDQQQQEHIDVQSMLDKRVVAMYAFEKSNEDDLALQEGDILLVIGVNYEDTNWVRARHLGSGLEGYVPSSYIQLKQEGQDGNDEFGDSFDDGQDSQQPQQDETMTSSQAIGAGSQSEQIANYCRALYDYQPSDGDVVVEEDGLPHLCLQQGELMRIIDQGQDDGWWLVEKSDGTLGHVPSMLVEDLDDGEGSAEDEDDSEEDGLGGDVGAAHGDAIGDNKLDIAAVSSSLPPPPDIEAPVPELEDEKYTSDTTLKAEHEDTNHASLMATSFVIIEPTPDVETERFVLDNETQEGEQIANKPEEYQEKPEVGSRHTRAPSSDVSYSIIKEDFVLERPTRKPYSGSSSADGTIQQQHEPTIEEEEISAVDQSTTNRLSDAQNENQNEEIIEYAVPPVSVVIDTVEAIPRSPDESFDLDGRDDVDSVDCSAGPSGGQTNDQTSSSASDVQNDNNSCQKVRHKNVDCSPILRHHAEEFSKMIIEEALMLAPGSRIGPSTSSASIDRNEQADTLDYSDDE